MQGLEEITNAILEVRISPARLPWVQAAMGHLHRTNTDFAWIVEEELAERLEGVIREPHNPGHHTI